MFILAYRFRMTGDTDTMLMVEAATDLNCAACNLSNAHYTFLLLVTFVTCQHTNSGCRIRAHIPVGSNQFRRYYTTKIKTSIMLIRPSH